VNLQRTLDELKTLTEEVRRLDAELAARVPRAEAALLALGVVPIRAKKHALALVEVKGKPRLVFYIGQEPLVLAECKPWVQAQAMLKFTSFLSDARDYLRFTRDRRDQALEAIDEALRKEDVK
jgi:hypothetical protein